MGLDMYLSIKIKGLLPADESRGGNDWDSDFVSGYDFSDSSQEFWDIVNKYGVETLIDKDSPTLEISRNGDLEISAAYWRKENAIHAWFVNNCQNGNDDCAKHVVHIEQLAKLSSLCRTVISDPLSAEELLPPQTGFFFGSTDLDEWYFKGLKFTADRLEFLVRESLDILRGKNFSFIYHSSW